MADITINKKSDSTTPVSREAIFEALTSKNQSMFPVVYTEDVWTIVNYNTQISQLLQILSGCGETGTYALNVIIEALAAFINENREKINKALKVGTRQYETVQQIFDAFIAELDSSKEGESNGVKVKITQNNGKITSVQVTAPDFDSKYDSLGAAEAVRGLPNDPYNKSPKTVWSAYNAAVKAYDDALTAVEDLRNSMDTLTPITDVKIRNLFR